MPGFIHADWGENEMLRPVLPCILLLLGGCAYRANPVPAPALSVYSSYGEKLPGRYALLVEGGELSKSIRPTGLACAAHTFPLDLSQSFATSVQGTIANLVNAVQVVPSPLDRNQLRAGGYRAMIIVRGDSLEGKIVAVPGFWQATMSARVTITAGISVDSTGGRLLGQSVEGSAEFEASIGFACSGGANAMGEAAEDAMKKTMERLGEALTNSGRVRTAN